MTGKLRLNTQHETLSNNWQPILRRENFVADLLPYKAGPLKAGPKLHPIAGRLVQSRFLISSPIMSLVSRLNLFQATRISVPSVCQITTDRPSNAMNVP